MAGGLVMHLDYQDAPKTSDWEMGQTGVSKQRSTTSRGKRDGEATVANAEELAAMMSVRFLHTRICASDRVLNHPP